MARQILSGDPRLTGPLAGQGYGGALSPDFSEASPGYGGAAGLPPAELYRGMQAYAAMERMRRGEGSIGDKFSVLAQIPERVISGTAGSVADMFTLPHDAAYGQVDLNSPEAIERGLNFAGGLTLGAGALPAAGNELRMGMRAAGDAPQTFSHPISGVKLKTPIEEMNPTYDTKGIKMLPEKSLHPESLQGGYVIPMRGDPTIAGKRLTGVGGEKFEDPVTLHGGPAFARGPQQITEGAGWASNPGPSTVLGNRAAEIASETGDPVFGAYMKMSPTSGDYSTMMSETLREMIKLNPPSRKGVREFNKAMREKWGDFPATPDFPGVENLTDEWIRAAGKHRTKLAQMMDSKRFGDLGFPEVGVARHAITEPDLLDVPSHSSGFSVVQFPSSGEVIKNPKIAHPTYAQQNKATYEGRLPELPLDVLYGPEVRASTGPQYLAKILETKPPTVKVDQKTLDRVMKYLRSQDGAKWGLAGAIAGGLLTAEQAKELEGT